MNIEIKQSDALSMTLGLTIEPSDYTERVHKSLQEYRRKAEIKGFRKGMVPMGLIEKMHGRTALLEEVNKLISEGLNNHIEENKIRMIGEPLPNEDLQPKIDWEHADTFTFIFDLMLSPKVELNLTADDHIPLKQPKISKKDKEEYIESLRKQFGKLSDAEAAQGEDFLKVDLSQGDKCVNATYISLKSMGDEKLKQPFIGLKSGDAVEVDVVRYFPNGVDRAALLKVKREELDDTNPFWLITVLEVKRFGPAALDQEFYDRLFGEGVVDSPETFTKKVEERMCHEFEAESDYRFTLDARKYLIDKCAIALPDALIKRWLHHSNDGKVSMEEIERDYDAFARDFRWQLIRGYLMKEHQIEIVEEEMMDKAMKVAQYRFATYGMSSVPEEHLKKYAGSLLTNEKEAHKIVEMVEDDKVFAFIRTKVTLDPEKVPFSKMSEMNTSV